jgi:biopolymer transport protein ExbB
MIAIEQFSTVAWAILGALGLMSVFALTIFLLKITQFAQMGVGSRKVGRSVTQVFGHWQRGDMRAAHALMHNSRALRLQVLGRLVQSDGHNLALLQARDGIEMLSRQMRGLEAVVQAAPMVGLLGTVVGMIEAFSKLAATSGAADPAQLAGGIWTALVTTALGLCIAIVFYLASLWLDGRIAGEAHALEQMFSAIPHAPQTSPVPAAMAADAYALPPQTASPLEPPSPSPLPASAPNRTQPVPGGLGQRTDPGRFPLQNQAPGSGQTTSLWDNDAGPKPETFRSRP